MLDMMSNPLPNPNINLKNTLSEELGKLAIIPKLQQTK